MSRLEDEETGAVRPAELYAQVPSERVAQARRAATALGDAVYTKFPLMAGMSAMSEDLTELVLNRTWRPQLAVIGIDGLPDPMNAGQCAAALDRSQGKPARLPPTLNPDKAGDGVRRLLGEGPTLRSADRLRAGDREPLVGTPLPCRPGSNSRWNTLPKLAFGAPPAYMGEGGSIPFMAMLGEKFPQAQFVVTGVLGPHSNAHGPNEFLHIPTGKRISVVIAQVLAHQHAQSRSRS